MIVFLPGCLVVYRLGVWCFHLPRFGILFRWIVFVWHHLMYLVLFYSFVSVFFFWISGNSRSENQPFFVIVLTWSVNLWLVVWNVERSCQIYVTLFLYPLCDGLLQKLHSSASLFSSQVHVLCLGHCCGLLCRRLCTWKKSRQHS